MVHTYTKYLMEYMFEMMIHKHTKTVSFMKFLSVSVHLITLHHTLFQINNSIEYIIRSYIFTVLDLNMLMQNY